MEKILRDVETDDLSLYVCQLRIADAADVFAGIDGRMGSEAAVSFIISPVCFCIELSLCCEAFPAFLHDCAGVFSLHARIREVSRFHQQQNIVLQMFLIFMVLVVHSHSGRKLQVFLIVLSVQIDGL